MCRRRQRRLADVVAHFAGDALAEDALHVLLVAAAGHRLHAGALSNQWPPLCSARSWTMAETSGSSTPRTWTKRRMRPPGFGVGNRLVDDLVQLPAHQRHLVFPVARHQA